MIVDSKKRQKCVLSVFAVLFFLILGNLINDFNIIDFAYLIVIMIFGISYFQEVKK